jgi:hypothetical protein
MGTNKLPGFVVVDAADGRFCGFRRTRAEIENAAQTLRASGANVLAVQADLATEAGVDRRQLFLHSNDNYSCRAGAGLMERHGDQRAFRIGLGKAVA